MCIVACIVIWTIINFEQIAKNKEWVIKGVLTAKQRVSGYGRSLMVVIFGDIDNYYENAQSVEQWIQA